MDNDVTVSVTFDVPLSLKKRIDLLVSQKQEKRSIILAKALDLYIADVGLDNSLTTQETTKKSQSETQHKASLLVDDLHIATLRYVFFFDYDLPYLPVVPCVYFAIDDLNNIVYIGQTTKENRIKTHHRRSDFIKINVDKIAYLPVDRSLLKSVEARAIKRFNPYLNRINLLPRLFSKDKSSYVSHYNLSV